MQRQEDETKMTSTGKQFRCELYTTLSPYRDADAFARLWSVLADPDVGAVSFDSFERRHRYQFTPEPAEAFAMVDYEQTLYVKGDRDDFLFAVMGGDNGTFRTTVYLDASEWTSRWIPWILRLAGELPVLFGVGCTRAEHDAKHLTIRELSGGGSAEGAVGFSNAEFQKYLPGIYWLTVFGPELATELDFSGLVRLPVTLTTLANGGRALMLDEPLAPDDIPARLELEAQIADVLGARYFFDRDRKDLAFEHPPAFKAVLDQLAGRR